jgi:hypothetical protein
MDGRGIYKMASSHQISHITTSSFLTLPRTSNKSSPFFSHYAFPALKHGRRSSSCIVPSWRQPCDAHGTLYTSSSWVPRRFFSHRRRIRGSPRQRCICKRVPIRERSERLIRIDPQASDIPDKCNIEMRTTDGGNCQVQVFCSDDRDAKGIGLDANQVCYVGGQQYLTHPKLGDFSITYTKAGGVDGKSSP